MLDDFKTIKEASQSGDTDAMVNCLGKGNSHQSRATLETYLANTIFSLPAYPPECTSDVPPLTQECLNAIWKAEGCSEHGAQYPASLAGDKRSVLDSYNIQYAIIYGRIDSTVFYKLFS